MSIPLVHRPEHYSDIGVHVFPTQKFALVLEGIRGRVNGSNRCLQVPPTATREQLLRVHTAEYLADLDACQRTARTLSSELPLTRQIIDAYCLMAGGTCLAAELALTHGCARNLGGGFHHAFADRAEGLCHINDVAVAVRDVQALGRAERVAVIDTDLHQRNGTAGIFGDDLSVFTFSIHQENQYPPKEQSDLDIGLEDGIGDDEYLRKLEIGLEILFNRFQSQLVIYVGGVDPQEEDLLGELRLSKNGIKIRGATVHRWARTKATFTHRING